MPYTKPESRAAVDTDVNLNSPWITTWSAGDLTYAISKLVWTWVKPRKSYLNFAIVIGCLICAAFEFYRRVVAPYEDQKIQENGDVYV